MLRAVLLISNALSIVFVATGCGKDSPPGPPGELGRCAEFDELRQPFFGETHVHTVLSLDANLQGTRPTPMDAYEFARGKTIPVQPYDDEGNGLREATIDRPLDFVMVSDHSEFLATIVACNDPEHPSYDTMDCVDYRDPAKADQVFLSLNVLTAAPQNNVRYPALCGENNEACIDAGMDAWERIQETAEAVYDRTDSCEFTSFVGYEWTGGPGARNLHRNIMFRNEVVPDWPVSYFDEPYPEDLWASLREDCIDDNSGCDALCIPHNSNISRGLFFEQFMKDDKPFNAEYAQLRNELETVIEVYQHKGASECLPGETAEDELCGFEILPYADLAGTNLKLLGDANPTDFLRSAYGEGMKLQKELGVNPFQHGIIAGTDTHISAPGLVKESDFIGHGGAGQSNRDVPPEGFPDIPYLSGGGLAGVWAEENSRDAIFLAMRRKETFGTSGPRIIPRVFGGWDLPSDLCDSSDLEERGYELGVPMGAELGPAPSDSATPKFVVSAMQDPEGAPLQRVQVVKGWLEGDEYKVKVYDIAGDKDNGASVNLSTCEPQGTGFASDCTWWEDENFDASQRAYYYVRVIQNPTCRWSAQLCADSGYDCDNPTTEIDEDCCDPTSGLNVDFCDEVAAGLSGMEAECCQTNNPISSENVEFCQGVALSIPVSFEGQCCLPRIETSIQERAWTSPIWYQPAN